MHSRSFSTENGMSLLCQSSLARELRERRPLILVDHSLLLLAEKVQEEKDSLSARGMSPVLACLFVCQANVSSKVQY